MCGNSAYCWKTVLTSRRYGGVPTASVPPMRISPWSGCSKAASGRRQHMRIGTMAAETGGAQALGELADQLRRAADDGFASVWMSNIFGLEALTSLAVSGSQVPGIELGTAVIPTYPRHPAVLAQQALTVALAVGPGRLALGIGLSHKIVIEDMYGYSFDKP